MQSELDVAEDECEPEVVNADGEAREGDANSREEALRRCPELPHGDRLKPSDVESIRHHDDTGEGECKEEHQVVGDVW